jgi:hypothetical protein
MPRADRSGADAMKQLRDALIAGATIALLLYVAMTAAKSMADVLQPSVEANAPVNCAAAAATEPCRHALQVAQGNN